jgi:hypothetical protein
LEWIFDLFVDDIEEVIRKKVLLKEIYSTIEIVKDLPGYFISPHTDIESKLLTLLFYLPKNRNLEKFETSFF